VGSTRARRAGSRRRGTTRWCPNPRGGGTRCPAQRQHHGATASSLTKTALHRRRDGHHSSHVHRHPLSARSLPGDASARSPGVAGSGRGRAQRSSRSPIQRSSSNSKRASLSSTTLCNCPKSSKLTAPNIPIHTVKPRARSGGGTSPPSWVPNRSSSVRSASGARPRGAEGARVAVGEDAGEDERRARRGGDGVIGRDVARDRAPVDERVLVGCARPQRRMARPLPGTVLEVARATPASADSASAPSAL